MQLHKASGGASPDSHNRLTFEVLTEDDALDKVRSTWNRLYDQSTYRPVTLSFDWISQAWIYYRRFDPSAQLCLIIINANPETVGILPLMRIERKARGLVRIREMHFLLHDWNDYAGFLIQHGYEEKVARIFVEEVLKTLDWDRLLLKNMSAEWPLLNTLSTCLTSAFEATLIKQKSSYYRIEPGRQTFDQYWQCRPEQFKQNLRTAQNRLRRDFAATTLIAERSLREIDRLDDLADLYGQRLKVKNRNTPGYRHFLDFVMTYCKNHPDRVQVFTCVLDKIIVSFAINLTHQNGVHYWVPGFRTGYEKYSPGHLLLHHMIGVAFERRQRFDFMRGESAYKSRWADQYVRSYQIATLNTNKRHLKLFRLLQA